MTFPLFHKTAAFGAPFNMLKKDCAQDLFCHAYILISPDRLYSSLLSRMFADLLITGGAENNQSEMIFTDRHADVFVVPERTEDGKRKETVQTAEIDKIVSSRLYRPVYSDKKVYIIDFAETMNAAGQNKLLKTLEEPLAGTVIILNCAQKSTMLPTVLSRCKQMVLPPLGINDIKNSLREVYGESERLELAAAAGGGDLEKSLKLMTDNAYYSLFDNSVAVLLSLNSSKNILQAAAKVLNFKDNLNGLIEFFEMIFRDVMVFHEAGEKIVTLAGGSDYPQRLAKMYSAGACLEIISALLHAKERISRYGNVNSIIDELLFAVVENKAKYSMTV